VLPTWKSSKVSEKITEQGHNEAPSADAAAFVIMASERWIEQHRKEASVRLLDTKIIGSAADSPSSGNYGEKPNVGE